jgi:DNA polymerase
MATSSAADYVPDTHQLADLSAAARGCKGCDLYLNATQTVFGAGSSSADIMLVGEQPGDQEDRAGAPFVGPAGKLLDKALAAAEINRDRLYVTNAVKHFKFTLERGKRRIHKTPSRTEVVACRPWLLAELMSVQPEVVVPPHPSSVLRGPPEDREKAFDGLVSDLRLAAELANR